LTSNKNWKPGLLNGELSVLQDGKRGNAGKRELPYITTKRGKKRKGVRGSFTGE